VVELPSLAAQAHQQLPFPASSAPTSRPHNGLEDHVCIRIRIRNHQNYHNQQQPPILIQKSNSQGGSTRIQMANQQQIGRPKLGSKKCVSNTTIIH
jgi:hypothetical protein